PIVRSTCMPVPPTHDVAPSTKGRKGRFRGTTFVPQPERLEHSRCLGRPGPRSAARAPLGGGSEDGFRRSCGGPRSLWDRSLGAGCRPTLPVEAFVPLTIALPARIRQ